MGSFLSGIFAGSNPTLEGDIGNAGNVMGFGTAVGEGDIGAASNFDQTLLEGDPAATAKLLAPQIGGITGRAQQQKNTIAQFGNRSGGNNSKAQTIDDTTRGSIDDMVSKLTGKAAGDIGSLGTSTLGIGLNANQLQEQESQQKLQNEQNSLFGQAINGAANYAESFLPIAHGG
jgi:hypothetical protein